MERQRRNELQRLPKRSMIRFEKDQGKVHEEDKSFFLLSIEISIRRHSISQKLQWIESVDMAVNAWYRTQQAVGTLEGGALLHLAPCLWQRNHGWCPSRVRKK